MRFSISSTLVLIALAGCDGVECGPGTTLIDGVCEPDEGGGGGNEGEDFCGANTEFVDGECVPDSSTVGECGPGTTLVDGECVSTTVEVECGPGTTLVDDECVPDATLAECGPGTELVGDECVSTIECAPGTLLVGTECVLDCPVGQIAQAGECLEPAEVDATNPDLTETEPNDPVYGGTPESTTLPPAGTSVIVVGTIGTPVDLDADTVPDQDFDVVDFDVSPGDVVQVTLTPLNGADIGFALREDTGGYLRNAPGWVQTSPHREFLITQGGTYSLEIAPTGHIQGIPLGPVGGPGWDYVVTLERRTYPTAQVLAVDTPTTGDLLDSNNNLYQVQAAAGVPTTVEVVTGPHASAIATNVDSAGTARDLGSGPTFTYTPATDDDFYVFVDFFSLNGADDDYSLLATSQTSIWLGTIPSDGLLTPPAQPGTLAQVATYSFDIDANHILSIQADQQCCEPPVVTEVRDPSGTVIYQPVGEPSGTPNIWAEQAGTWEMDVRPNGNGDVDFYLRSHSLIDLGTADATTNTSLFHDFGTLAASERQWYTFDVADDIAVDVWTLQTSGSLLGLFVYDQAFDSLGTSFLTATPNVTVPSLLTGERAFFEVNNLESTADVQNLRVNVDVTVAPFMEVEPNDALNPTVIPDGTTKVGGLITTPDTDWFEYTPSVGGLYSIEVTPAAGAGAGLYFDIYSGIDLIEASYHFAPTVSIVLEAGRTYQFNLYAESEPPGGRTYEIDIQKQDPKHEEEVGDNDDPTNPPLPVALTAVGPHLASATGTLTGAGDTADCYTLLAPSDATYTIHLDGVAGSRGPQVLASSVDVSFFESDGLTPISRTATEVDLTTAPAYACVSGYANGGGNTYTFELTNDSAGGGGPSVGTPFTTTAIPDGDSGGVLVGGFLDMPCTIAGIDVDVDVTHTQRLDLQIDLISPSATEFVLKYPGAGGFGADLIGNYPADFTPADDWSSLVGTEASGNWYLRFTDDFSGDSGNINSWWINFSCF